MKKIILIALLPITIVMAGSFVMTEGNPLTKIEEDNPPAPSPTELSTAGCTDSYSTTINVNSASALTSAVANANVSTRIIVANGTYASNISLNGNSASVCIKSETKNGAKIQSQLLISSDNITVSGFMFNGSAGQLFTTGEYTRITNNTWNDSQANYWLISRGSIGTEIDHNTFKNKTNNTSIVQGMVIELRTYIKNMNGTITKKSNAKIHHNYFKNIYKGSDSNGFESIFAGTYVNESDDRSINRKSYIAESGFVAQKNEGILIAYNYFDNASGEGELISMKSDGITVEYNTINKSYGAITARISNGSVIRNNYILGGNYKDVNGVDVSNRSGGITVMHKNNEVYNNYIENLSDVNSAAILVHGEGETSSTIIVAADNHNIYNNYIDNCPVGIRYGKAVEGETRPAQDGSFKDNYVLNTTIPIRYYAYSQTKIETTYNNEITGNITTGTHSWDMSNQLTDNDVANGTIGAGI